VIERLLGLDTALTNFKQSDGFPLDLRNSTKNRVHLVGIAGSGLRAMAEVLSGWECEVSGSDVRLMDVKGLGAGKIRLFEGHSARHLSPEADLVIRSDAIPDENPEIRAAQELGIPILSYFDVLGQLSQKCHTVAIAGTHGKSTTTAMTAHILVEAGHDPTVFCGATPLGKTSGGRACRFSRSAADKDSPRPQSGEGPGVRAADSAADIPLLLVEACEFRKNFLKLQPTHAAILNIEPDHFDCYDSLDALEQAFRQFAASLPTNGLLVVPHADASITRVTAGLACQTETFSFSPAADWHADSIEDHLGRFRFEIRHRGQPLGFVQLQTPGRHNILNALAAAALAHANGASSAQIIGGLESFEGLHRRLEILGKWRDIAVVDDYAHHPTEVTASLQAIRSIYPKQRIWCVFQPHQASRTARLLDELAVSLQNADCVLIGEIFRAREGTPQPGEVTAADLARRVAELGVPVFPGSKTEEIVKTLETHLAPGDVLATLGAGDTAPFRPMGLFNDKPQNIRGTPIG
jgi:UDP-N-acetylmuramate--alanine ligase